MALAASQINVIQGTSTEESEYSALSFSSAIALTIPAGIKHVKRRLNLTGNVSIFTLSGEKSGDRGSIYVFQDSTGGRTLPMPVGHIGEFDINTGANEVTELLFEHNGVNVVWRSAPVTL